MRNTVMYTSHLIKPAGLAVDASSTGDMSISFMTSISEQDEGRVLSDDDCPDYDAVVSGKSANSNGMATSSHYLSPYDGSRLSMSLPQALMGVPQDRADRRPSSGSVRRNPRPLPQHERYIYTYQLLANATPLHFMISVEPETGKPKPGKYVFRLSFKANGIERSLCEATTRILKVNPRQLTFVVFMFPGKAAIPAGCLWSLRVWLRVNNIDHRLFGEDDLWVAKDPDFDIIGDASFLKLKHVDTGEQVYSGFVGKAWVTFTIRWQCVSNNLYKYSLMYEASGVGDTLFEGLRLRLDGDPRRLTFLIFTVPTNSMPAGATHKLRVWTRSPVPLATSGSSTPYVLPFKDSYIYHRIWKLDSFKIGGQLDFESLGSKMIMGFSSRGPETIMVPDPPAVDLHTKS